MKTKVKLFSSNKVSALEKELNEFIEENQVEIIDIKITMTIHMLVASLVYKTE